MLFDNVGVGAHLASLGDGTSLTLARLGPVSLSGTAGRTDRVFFACGLLFGEFDLKFFVQDLGVLEKRQVIGHFAELIF